MNSSTTKNILKYKDLRQKNRIFDKEIRKVTQITIALLWVYTSLQWSTFPTMRHTSSPIKFSQYTNPYRYEKIFISIKLYFRLLEG